MPLYQKAEEAGIIKPAQLALLSRVFQATSRNDESQTDREARASRILGYYLAGIEDEAELRTLAKQPLQR
ncbi:hypothetical protein [Aliihoeflea sp. PC F10.4]